MPMTDPKALAEEIIQSWYDAISPDLRKRIGVEEGKSRIAVRLAAFADEVRIEEKIKYYALVEAIDEWGCQHDHTSILRELLPYNKEKRLEVRRATGKGE